MTTGLNTTLVHFFTQVAKRDPAQLDKLRAAFDIDTIRWNFTLPSLYDYLRDHDHEALGQLEYKHFRRLVFSSPINQTIGDYGARITIVDNRGKTDRSVYALEWSSPDVEQ